MDSASWRYSIALLTVTLLVGTILAGLTPTAAAQQPEGRTLGGYSFVPSSRVADPFITTHFRNATGLGMASNVLVPILVVDEPPPAEPDTLLELSGNLVYVLVDFEYQQRLGNRVAVRLSGGGGSRLGTGVESMLSQGVSVVTNFLAGTTVRLWSSDKFMVSGVFDVGYGSSLRIDLLGWAEQIIEEGIDTDASITTVDDGVVLDGGARVAWAPKPHYGFTGLVQLGYSSALRNDSRVDGEVALTGSIDFAQKGGAPIGLLDLSATTGSIGTGATPEPRSSSVWGSSTRARKTS